jgi:hypothetical protein
MLIYYPQDQFIVDKSFAASLELKFHLGVKQPGHKAYHSPPSNAKSRMCGAIPPLPNTPSRRGAQLKKAQGQLYLYFYMEFTVFQNLSFDYTYINVVYYGLILRQYTLFSRGLYFMYSTILIVPVFLFYKLFYHLTVNTPQLILLPLSRRVFSNDITSQLFVFYTSSAIRTLVC